MKRETPAPSAFERTGSQGKVAPGTTFVKVEDARPDGYDGTCLRPLGLCELGGCCDTCWYRPNHPRFRGDGS